MGNQTSAPEYDKTSERKPTVDNFVGCLVGVCIGDALGFMVEGDSPGNSKKFVDSEIRPCIADPSAIKTHLHDRTYGKGISIGQYSDDSQLSRELLLSFVNTFPLFSPQDYADRIADLFKQSKIMGCGKATAKAVAKLNRGITWDKAGSKEGETGNGSAMRSGPIGLMFWDNQELLLECCEKQSLITHQDKRCIAGSVAIAASVVWCITHSQFHADHFTQFVANYVSCVDKSFAEYVLQLNKWFTLSPEKAAKIIGKLGTDYDDGSIGISGFVTSSVVWSMYCFMKSPNDFMEAVCIAIQAGGDTDSTAAMLGAISGAFLGEAKIPKEFVEVVNDRGEWTSKELKELAIKCYELKNKD